MNNISEKLFIKVSKFNSKLCKQYKIDILDILENKSLEKIFLLSENKELTEKSIFLKICSYSHDLIRNEKMKISQLDNLDDHSENLSYDDYLLISNDFFSTLNSLSEIADSFLDYIFALTIEQQTRLLRNTKKIDLLTESFSNATGYTKQAAIFALSEIKNKLSPINLMEENELIKISKMKKSTCTKCMDVKNNYKAFEHSLKPCLESPVKFVLSLFENKTVSMHFPRPKYF
jgi:hypothetical protein